MKITLEDSAKTLLDSHFSENPPAECLRVYMKKQSSGNRLALSPDTQSERDLVIDASGYLIVISKHLADQLGAWIKIRGNSKGGFSIEAEKNSLPKN